MMKENRVEIKPIAKHEIDIAAELVAKTMAHNPLHIAIFKNTKQKAIRKQQRMFEKALSQPYNDLYAAKINGEIVGVMCYTDSDHCQLKPLQFAALLPGMVLALGNLLPKVLKWRMNWKKHDLKKPHIHFGPIAVHPEYQGKGIGTKLLQFFCDAIDKNKHTGYLETDKQENLSLYERFGFKIIEEDEIFGVRNWFMVR